MILNMQESIKMLIKINGCGRVKMNLLIIWGHHNLQNNWRLNSLMKILPKNKLLLNYKTKNKIMNKKEMIN